MQVNLRSAKLNDVLLTKALIKKILRDFSQMTSLLKKNLVTRPKIKLLYFPGKICSCFEDEKRKSNVLSFQQFLVQ